MFNMSTQEFTWVSMLHLDCSRCHSTEVAPVGFVDQTTYGLFVKVRCFKCGETTECGDGQFFTEKFTYAELLSQYSRAKYELEDIERRSEIFTEEADFEAYLKGVDKVVVAAKRLYACRKNKDGEC